MATGISSAEYLPDGDYSVAHRPPPPIPSVAYSNTAAARSPSPGPNELGTSKYASESASVNSRDHRRRPSLGSFLRRSSSHARQSQSPPDTRADVPPVPNTRIGQAHYQASISSDRKVSGEGRNMLRKGSRMKREEQERLEQERLARARAPPQKLPSIAALTPMETFGSEDSSNTGSTYNTATYATYTTAPAPANFSRPGNAFANRMPSSNTQNSSSSPAYAIRPAQQQPSPPGGKSNGEYVNHYSMDRTESMTNRGRYSYASSIVPVNTNSPRRVRRRKDPTPFNVLIIGAKNSGKTSFISFLRHSLALPSNREPSSQPEQTINSSKSSFTSHYLETEMDGERVGLTLWDSAGLEKSIVDLQLREMAAFVESKFEETFLEEQKVMRSPGVKDTHIHCAFLILDPIRLDATVAASEGQKDGLNIAQVTGLDDDLDLQVMRALSGKTTVIPVISKADTLTQGHMSFLKRAVWQSIKGAKLDPLEALELEDDIEEEDEEEEEEDDESAENSEYSDAIDGLVDRSDSDESDKPVPKSKKTHNRGSSLTVTSTKPSDDETPYIPMSILSPDPYDLPPYTPISKSQGKPKAIGRKFPWGFADPYNAEHCDFTRLRDSIFSEWKGELRDLSRTKWYENWRTSRLKNLPGSRQRVKGGVTPTAAVPKEGLSSPEMSRRFSPPQANGGAVPRSVSAASQQQQQQQGPSKAERMMGIAAAGNGQYRNVAS